jgi:integrase
LIDETQKRNRTSAALTDSPATALAHQVAHILEHTADITTPLCIYYAKKKPKHIRATHINTNVKNAITALGLASAGFTSRLVSSHSLQAGGAMAMNLNSADRDTIQKQGRWSSDTFLMYIHEQIAAFSSGLATQMSKHIPLSNIRGPSLHQTAAPTPTKNPLILDITYIKT